ncbi:MAG: S-methyl-5-thioribose-1-phosphate isomerase [Planctomycetota bacterium]
MHVETIRWEGGLSGCVRLLDQTLLPGQQIHLEITTVDAMRGAIARLAVRGAPAIGVAAAFGVVLGARTAVERGPAEVLAAARTAASTLERARPTAINLAWGVRRMVARAERELSRSKTGTELAESLLSEARSIWEEDRAVCEKLGEVGSKLLRDGARVLTHCNAGALATAGRGTALAPIYLASERGLKISVFADETRPLLQGARLTAWELSQAGIDVTLITDNAAARVFSQGKIDLVFVGADRIALNGDVANKIGTYGVAVLAREHQVPFYVVAPLSTFDPEAADGAAIPIEERAPAEVSAALPGVRVYNPAFDVTPARLVTGIVTEVGLIERPDRARVEAALRREGRI